MSRVFFEDLQIGDEQTTAGRTITEADIVAFAGLSGDYTELHTNAEKMKDSPFGRRIAHGLLTLSVTSGLLTRLGSLADAVIAYYGIDRLRFTAPVFAGDTITVSSRVIGLDDKKGKGGVATFEKIVRNQKGETVLVFTDRLMLRRRS